MTPRDRTKPNPRWYQNLLGPYNAHSTHTPVLPSMRPHYPAAVARALHALAESRPTPAEYTQRRERILAGKP